MRPAVASLSATRPRYSVYYYYSLPMCYYIILNGTHRHIYNTHTTYIDSNWVLSFVFMANVRDGTASACIAAGGWPAAVMTPFLRITRYYLTNVLLHYSQWYT